MEMSIIEISVEKPGPYQFLKVEGLEAHEGRPGLVSLKSFEPILEDVESDCQPLTIVDQHNTESMDASDVLKRDNKQWRGSAGAFFIIDLGCSAAIDSLEIDNRKHQDGDFTEILEVFGGESKLGPWGSIFYTSSLQPDPNIVLEINNPGPFRFLKVVAVGADTESNWVGFFHFHPSIHKTTGR